MPHTRVYVYGTLRKNGRNSRLMLGSVHEGELRLPGFAIYSMGSYPALVPGKSTDSVLAESWLVDSKTLFRLDQLEQFISAGHPSNHYDRVLISTPEFGPGWLYLYGVRNIRGAKKHGTKIESGDWIRFAQS